MTIRQGLSSIIGLSSTGLSSTIGLSSIRMCDHLPSMCDALSDLDTQLAAPAATRRATLVGASGVSAASTAASSMLRMIVVMSDRSK